RLVYVVLAKCRLILSEAKAAQPDYNLHDGALQSRLSRYIGPKRVSRRPVGTGYSVLTTRTGHKLSAYLSVPISTMARWNVSPDRCKRSEAIGGVECFVAVTSAIICALLLPCDPSTSLRRKWTLKSSAGAG